MKDSEEQHGLSRAWLLLIGEHCNNEYVFWNCGDTSRFDSAVALTARRGTQKIHTAGLGLNVKFV